MPPRPSAAGGESAYEKRLKKAFHLFDADGSGALSVDEIREVLTRQTGDTKLTEADVKEIIADFDTVSACARLPARVRSHPRASLACPATRRNAESPQYMYMIYASCAPLRRQAALQCLCGRSRVAHAGSTA